MSLFNSYNKVTVVGNLTRDIEIRTISSGAQVTDFAVAVNDRIKQGDQWKDDTTFVDITAWGKTAELLQRFGGKGKMILVEGRLKQDKWVDKETDRNRTKLKVVAESITFLSAQGQGQGDPKPRQSKPDFDPVPEAESEDVPF